MSDLFIDFLGKLRLRNRCLKEYIIGIEPGLIWKFKKVNWGFLRFPGEE